MNIISWNVRGLNTENKILSVFDTLKSHRAIVIALYETMLNDNGIQKFMPKFGPH